MKKHLIILLTIINFSFIINNCAAQAPSGFTYQSVIRDSNNDLVLNTMVGVQISILQTTSTGTAVYVETHSVSTNANGLLSLQVGSGSVQSGTFGSIAWGSDAYYIKSEADPSGGTTYTITGTQQLMSVPYALYAANVGSAGSEITDTDNDTKIQVEESADEDIIRFDVAGTEKWIMTENRLESVNSGGSLFVGEGAGANDNLSTNRNVFLGKEAGNSNTAGSQNAATGYRSLYSNIQGNGNTANGYESMTSNTDGDNNAAIGYRSLAANTTGGQNVAMGNESLSTNTGGGSNTAIGHTSMRSNLFGSENTAVGRRSLLSNTNGSFNTSVGYESLSSNTTGQKNTALGYGANVTTGSLSRATAIGYNAKVATSNSLVLGGTGADTVYVGIGTTSPSATLDVVGTVQITGGSPANGKVLTSTDSAGNATWQAIATATYSQDADSDTKIQVEESADEDVIRFDMAGTEFFRMNGPRLEVLNSGGAVFIGESAGQNDNLSFSQNIAIGNYASQWNTNGAENVAIGYSALTNSSASRNTAIGTSSMSSNTFGSSNTAIGLSALFVNRTGNNNVATGHTALFSNFNGSNNVGIGFRALYENVTGSNNTALGNLADVTTGSLTNATAIGYNAKVAASNSLVLGSTGVNAVKVGIGTDTPTELLTLAGTSGTDGILFPDNTLQTTAFTGADILNIISDADNDTKIQVEESPDEDIIRFDVEGAQLFSMERSGNFPYLRTTGLSLIIGANNSTNVTGNYNTALGFQAGQDLTSGGQNTLLGGNAGGKLVTGGFNLMSGNLAGQFITNGSANTILGGTAGRNKTSGGNNLIMGYAAGENNGTGSGNVFLGAFAGRNETGSQRVYIDNSASATPLFYGEFDNNIVGLNADVAIGHQSPQANLDVAGDASGTADNSILVRSGNNAAESISNQIMFSWDGGTAYKHAIKTRHQGNNDVGNAFDFFVWDQGTDAVGDVGTKRVLTIDGRHKGMVGIGESTPRSELHISDGSPSLKAVNDAGGYGASILITDDGLPRIYFEASSQPVGKKLMDILMINQKLSISSLTDNGTAWDTENILVAHRDGRVGIMTGNPQDELHVEGSIRMVDGNQTAGFIPISDANGTMAWTDPTTISTADDGDWTISGNDQYSAVSGKVGIGTPTPTSKLEVEGDPDQVAILTIDQQGNDQYVGTNIQRDGAERWFVGMNNLDDDLIFRSNGATNQMIIKNTNGRVGIGTDNPIAPLHVERLADVSYGGFTFYAHPASFGGTVGNGTVPDVSIHSAG
ncbi:MAG: hypothetical protein JKX84_10110, partial [Flavobacteriales bacterium]|nr:hypothetical protein [Flavobacteriales bacterium]